MHTNVGSRKCVNTPIWQGFAKALKKIVFGQVLQNVPKHYLFRRFCKTLDFSGQVERVTRQYGRKPYFEELLQLWEGYHIRYGATGKKCPDIFFFEGFENVAKRYQNRRFFKTFDFDGVLWRFDESGPKNIKNACFRKPAFLGVFSEHWIKPLILSLFSEVLMKVGQTTSKTHVLENLRFWVCSLKFWWKSTKRYQNRWFFKTFDYGCVLWGFDESGPNDIKNEGFAKHAQTTPKSKVSKVQKYVQNDRSRRIGN